MVKKQIGDILVEQTIITQEQLNECLQEQQTTGEVLSTILVTKNYASKSDLAKALAVQLGMPFIEKITEQMADPQLLSKVPLKFLRQHVVIPVMFEGQKTIVTANPRDLQPLDDLSLLMASDIQYAITSEKVIIDAINRFYPLETGEEVMEELAEEEGAGVLDLSAIEGKDIMEMANEAPIVKLVNQVIFQAVKEGSSDIHIEPFEKELRIRYRIDGNMYLKFSPPKRYQGAIVSRIKIMSNLNIAEKRIPQDGRIQVRVADKAIDLRVSVLPSNFGERVVMRILDKSKGTIEIEAFDMSERDYNLVVKNIELPNGIILFSGPTGSGKTTTLYSILTRLNKPDVNIITVENPVEYTISGISQVQVNEKVGLTFASALRSILRQDPDTVLIGEIRDAETAQIAIQAALTGHLVLSTIHTNSAPATVTRMIDMGIEPFLIASSLILVIAQRLVRKLCDKCRQEHQPDVERASRLGLSPEEIQSITFYKGAGCDECLDTGYKGRIAIFEIMEVDDELAELIIKRVDSSVIRDKAIEKGMTQLTIDGIRAIKAGKTTIDEVLSVSFIQEADVEDTFTTEGEEKEEETDAEETIIEEEKEQ